jgi:hypothetical protein
MLELAPKQFFASAPSEESRHSCAFNQSQQPGRLFDESLAIDQASKHRRSQRAATGHGNYEIEKFDRFVANRFFVARFADAKVETLEPARDKIA